MNCSYYSIYDKCRLFILYTCQLLCCGCLVLMLLLWGNTAQAEISKEKPGTFETSSSCNTCHMNIYQQFTESMHARSFANPLFRTMFFDILLPRYAEDDALAEETKKCIGCHSPVTNIRTEGNIFAEQHVRPDFSGVECDLCHRITGYSGPKPQSGNYIAEPGTKKFGPFPQQSDWHHAYSELQTKSEFCAICHNRVNRFGLEIMSTFSEWQESRYAQIGIQCQDCHMNYNGFLTGGKPVYETGHASQNSLAKSPKRDRLYTHRFPGAHSETQVIGSIQLDIQVDESSLSAGEETIIYVTVDNSRSGHKLPTGSAELRLVYLDLAAQVGDRIISLPADSLNSQMFDVSGRGKYDAEMLGDTFPKGRRLYRAICVDSAEKQTLYAFDAEKIIFDNRLLADEVRREFFIFPVPEDIGSGLTLTAKLYYLRYPDSFAEKINFEKAKLIELASVRKDIVLDKQSE